MDAQQEVAPVVTIDLAPAEIVEPSGPTGAALSENEKYRYLLWRTWGEEGSRLLYIGVNPSTADAAEDDPTIRRMMGFARKFKFAGIEVVNLYSLRSADVGDVRKTPAPWGRLHRLYLEAAIARCHAVVAAWGSSPFTGSKAWRRQSEYAVREVCRCLDAVGKPALCLGKTLGQHPCHPLYLPDETQFELFRGAKEVEGGSAAS